MKPCACKARPCRDSKILRRQRVTTTYLDSSRQVIVAIDLNAENDKLLKTKTTTDMLGRPVLTEQTEDGTNYTISVKNAYLNMGRVTVTSSAMRSATSSTDGWTRVTKDNAGVVIVVATLGAPRSRHGLGPLVFIPEQSRQHMMPTSPPLQIRRESCVAA